MKQMIAFLADALVSPWYALFGPSVEVGQVWEAVPFPIFDWQTLTVVVTGVEAGWVEYAFVLRQGVISPVRHTRSVFGFRRFFRLKAESVMFGVVSVSRAGDNVLAVFDSRYEAERACVHMRRTGEWELEGLTLTVRVVCEGTGQPNEQPIN